jgi:hypothetical protein
MSARDQGSSLGRRAALRPLLAATPDEARRIVRSLARQLGLQPPGEVIPASAPEGGGGELAPGRERAAGAQP